ncbi:MAG: hypothetical protein LUQ54_02625, partial [Methanoregula sp.]|nr:hypothetical protein [Methanoregula sp.]
HPIRVLDLACGSGRVLLSAYRYILSHSGNSRCTLANRLDSLGASIYGVDMDQHAVAATKMLLFFELCDDMGPGAFSERFLTMAESVFRILGKNILCGNSLVDFDVGSEDSITISSPYEQRRINPFGWQNAFPDVLGVGGFDAVLGNLPDGPLDHHEWVQRYFQRHYMVYHPQADRSAYFMERGLSLLRPGGILCCITGNLWLRAKSGSPLRKFLHSFQIEDIVDYGTETENKLHPSLCLVRIGRHPATRGFFAARLDPEGAEPLEVQAYKGRFPVDQTVLGYGGWKFRDTRVQDIMAKVCNVGIPLEEAVMGRVHQGIITGLDELFLIDSCQRKELIEASPKSKSLIRPFLPAGDIVRYGYPDLFRFIIFIPLGWTEAHAGNQAGWRWFRNNYPAVARHMKSYAEKAKERKHKGDFWWEISCEPGAFEQSQPRIIFPASGEFPAFMFDERAFIPDHNSRSISSPSLYLLGVLNSRLSAFIFRAAAQKNKEIRRTQVLDRIAALPVYTPDFDNAADADRHARMVVLVTEMLEMHKHLSRAKSDREKRLITQEIESTDRQIDSLVYGLYGLTSDEIAVVEESVFK